MKIFVCAQLHGKHFQNFDKLSREYSFRAWIRISQARKLLACEIHVFIYNNK